MLGKNLKYDFKSTWKYFVILFIAIFIFTAISKILVEVSMSDIFSYTSASAIGTASAANDFQDMMRSTVGIFSVFSVFGYVLVLCLAPLVTFIVLIVRFYRNLFSNEGYLTNTLPVSSSSLLWSKIIMGLVWCLASVLVCVISVLIMQAGHITLADYYEYFSDTFFSDPEYIPLFFLLIICSALSLILGVFSTYACVSLGQLFAKHRIMAAILIFAAWGIVYNIIISVFFAVLVAGTVSVSGVWPVYILLGGTAVLDLVLCIGSYCLCSWILKSKLNLE